MKRLIALMILAMGLLAANAFADGIDEYTVLMLHFNGDFTDSSYSDHAVTVQGDVQLDSVEKRFGGGSAYFNGGRNYLTIPDSEDWAFYDGDFTIDLWVKFNEVTENTTYIFIGQMSSPGEADWSWSFYKGYTGAGDWNHMTFFWADDGTAQNRIRKAWEPQPNIWYHIAAARNGDEFRIFVDGNQLGSTENVTGMTLWNSSQDFEIGFDSSWHLSPMHGWMDEVRISKGIARWSAEFTPPTQEYDETPNSQPIAHAGPDLESYTGEEVVLDGSSSYDSDGDIVSWVWRSLSDPQKSIVAEGEVATMNAHGYVEELIELTVTDDRGATDTDTMSIFDARFLAVEEVPAEVDNLESQVNTLEQRSTSLEERSSTLEQENTEQQQTLDDNRYLLEQLPQLKHDLEQLQFQAQ